MKLILTREISGLGGAGDVVTVKDGYGRNFLLARGSAIIWTKGGEGQIDGIKRARSAREIRDLDHAKEIKTKLKKELIGTELRGKYLGIIATQIRHCPKLFTGQLLFFYGHHQ